VALLFQSQSAMGWQPFPLVFQSNSLINKMVNNSGPVASNVFVTGDEDAAYIVVTLLGSDIDPGQQIDGFRVNQLPTNGTLFLDAALTIAIVVGQEYTALGGTLPLYFKPDANFNGSVSFDYVATETLSGGTAAPSEYYLTVAGVDGGSVSALHPGAFEVSDFSFDVDSLIGAVAGGAGVSNATFSPLTVTLSNNAFLNGLLSKAATGAIIPLIRLEGVLPNSGGTVYDLRLGNVRVNHIIDTNGADQVQFNYKQISLTTGVQAPSGGLSTQTVLSWNQITNTGSSTPLGVPAAPNVLLVGGTAATSEYYL
jgi:type VI protein secretion system component Hcp